ncbi:hypothetical protein CAPTEDRAFT_225583 [Capitella teleta]|uniref:Uncharacterized protein n=1 Tax=Capitella teleta TaxID=283909 RepID=R7V209_CAPTE|nr:hypothetical protein CAPTEDRAFT_225583 [Capitella teleta]|eukprot:ELU09716.1 hypothetical protein CAPTEDRAFT_225583 [Capitella teleta]
MGPQYLGVFTWRCENVHLQQICERNRFGDKNRTTDSFIPCKGYQNSTTTSSHVWWCGFGVLWFVTIATIWLLLQTTANHLHVYSSDEILFASRRDEVLQDLKACPVPDSVKADFVNYALKCNPAKYFYDLRDALVNVADRGNVVTMVTEVNDINTILDFFIESVVQNELCNSVFVVLSDKWARQLSACGMTALVTQLSTQELISQASSSDFSVLFVHPSTHFRANPFAWFDCGPDCDVMVHPSAHAQSIPEIMYIKTSNAETMSKDRKIRHFPQEYFCHKSLVEDDQTGCVVML